LQNLTKVEMAERNRSRVSPPLPAFAARLCTGRLQLPSSKFDLHGCMFGHSVLFESVSASGACRVVWMDLERFEKSKGHVHQERSKTLVFHRLLQLHRHEGDEDGRGTEQRQALQGRRLLPASRLMPHTQKAEDQLPGPVYHFSRKKKKERR
jgi:hypothetical protein